MDALESAQLFDRRVTLAASWWMYIWTTSSPALAPVFVTSMEAVAVPDTLMPAGASVTLP